MKMTLMLIFQTKQKISLKAQIKLKQIQLKNSLMRKTTLIWKLQVSEILLIAQIKKKK